jgi:excisionase family DNA binding protein
VTIERDLYSLKEVAAKTGFSERTLVRCIKSGELPAFKLCSEWRVARADYLAWVNAGRFELDTPVVTTLNTASRRVKAVPTVQEYGLRQLCA